MLLKQVAQIAAPYYTARRGLIRPAAYLTSSTIVHVTLPDTSRRRGTHVFAKIHV
jgi:hypothetical protein